MEDLYIYEKASPGSPSSCYSCTCCILRENSGKKVSEDSRIAAETFSIVDGIKEAYILKDVSGMEKYTTSEGLRAITGR